MNFTHTYINNDKEAFPISSPHCNRALLSAINYYLYIAIKCSLFSCLPTCYLLYLFRAASSTSFIIASDDFTTHLLYISTAFSFWNTSNARSINKDIPPSLKRYAELRPRAHCFDLPLRYRPGAIPALAIFPRRRFNLFLIITSPGFRRISSFIDIAVRLSSPIIHTYILAVFKKYRKRYHYMRDSVWCGFWRS